MSDRQNAIRLLAADAHARGLSCFSNSLKIIADGYGKLESENAALKEENERLKFDVDSMMVAVKSAAYENTALKARVAELEAESVQGVANRICGQIPEGYEMRLHMENGAGWVELSSTNKDWIDFDGDTIIDSINRALDMAIKEPANEGNLRINNED